MTFGKKMRLNSPLIAAMLLLVGCGRAPMLEVDAREIAMERFEKVCANFKFRASDYDGPVSTAVGGVPFAFEWRDKKKKDYGVLITVAGDGETNVSLLK